MQRGTELLLFFLIVCCVSCQHDVDTAGYMKYVTDKEHGLIRTIQVDGWEYCMRYRPHDQIILMENRGLLKERDVTRRKSGLKGTVWFNISLKRMDNSAPPMRFGVSSLEEYNLRLSYFLNEATKDIRLLYGKDTLHPASYLFENNYNLTPMETMVIGFSLPAGDDAPRQDMRLTLFDRIFNNGIISAVFPVKVLKNIPNLIY